MGRSLAELVAGPVIDRWAYIHLAGFERARHIAGPAIAPVEIGFAKVDLDIPEVGSLVVGNFEAEPDWLDSDKLGFGILVPVARGQAAYFAEVFPKLADGGLTAAQKDLRMTARRLEPAQDAAVQANQNQELGPRRATAAVYSLSAV